MDWDKGFSASYYACLVDRATWRDTDILEITEGSITRSQSSLIESADITTTYQFAGERWVRVYMDARQNGATEHVALFTGLAIPPQTEIDGMLKKYKVECYSVLKPAEDILLERGFYLPAGMDSGEVLKNLLAVSPAPVEVDENAPELSSTIIAEQGESNLSMAIKVLKAINWRIRIDGSGTIHICRRAAEASVTFSATDRDSVEPQLTMTHDWFDCPNVFRAISGDLVAVARDDREDSILSTVKRGREVWMEETGCNLNINESIGQYAERRLAEEQSRAYEVRYSRRYDPDITVSDIVGLRYPAQGLDDDYTVTSQQITLGSGCRTEEQVEYS